MHIDQEKLREEITILDQLNLEVKIYDLVGTRVTAIETTFPIKGNAGKIKVLEDAGWEIIRKFRTEIEASSPYEEEIPIMCITIKKNLLKN